MVIFKDFVQKVTVNPGWFQSGQLEPLENTIARLNNWINEAEPDILNIETVWIPYNKSGVRDQPIKYSMSDGNRYYAIQIFRVWHQV